MTDPVVLYGDARAEVIASLRVLLAGRTETYLVDVHGVKPATGNALVVASADVTGGVRNITEQATVRVQVWHATSEDAHDMAQLARALLIVQASGDHLVRCDPLTGPFVTTDPDSGQPLAWFTVRAVMAGAAT